MTAASSLQEIGPRLPPGEHYLDFTGSSLYWKSQIEAALKARHGLVACQDRAASAEAAPEPLRPPPPLPPQHPLPSSLLLQELEAAVFGNPHSCNPSSVRTEQAVEALRERVLRFLGADPALYDVS